MNEHLDGQGRLQQDQYGNLNAQNFDPYSYENELQQMIDK